MNDNVQFSIQDNLGPGQYSGARVLIILDPEARLVYTRLVVGAGVPESVYHGEHMLVTEVSPETVPNTLESHLRTIDWDSLVGEYEGLEPEGGNLRARWTEASTRIVEQIAQEIENGYVEGKIVKYWSAADWYADGCDVDMSNGLNAAVEFEVAVALAQGFHLSAEDVRATLLEYQKTAGQG